MDIDQFMEDRVLVTRRARNSVAARLRKAVAQRDAALGADVRGRAEEKVKHLQAEDEQLDDEIERLATRKDDEYTRWRVDAHRRRYHRPHCERLFDVEFSLE